MSYSIVFGSSISGTGSVSQTKTVTLTVDACDNREIPVAVGADLLVDITMNLTTVKGYYICSDKALRLETNSSVGTGTAGETIDLVANQPIAWYDGCQHAKHFTSSITSLYVTNSGTEAAVLRISVAKDATP